MDEAENSIRADISQLRELRNALETEMIPDVFSDRASKLLISVDESIVRAKSMLNKIRERREYLFEKSSSFRSRAVVEFIAIPAAIIIFFVLNRYLPILRMG